MNNTTFGQKQGPFNVGEDILSDIIQQGTQNYISKIGIHCPGNYDLDLQGQRDGKQIFVFINGDNEQNKFQIGKTRMLEFQDVKITSLKFAQNMSQNSFIDYQYEIVQ